MRSDQDGGAIRGQAFIETWRWVLDNARKYPRTFWAFLKGDRRLVAESGLFSNALFFFVVSFVFFVVCVRLSFPDDPFRTFEGPSWFQPVARIYGLVPLFLAVIAIIWIVAINIPMLVIAAVLKYKIRFNSVFSANLYAFSVGLVVSSFVLITRPIIYDAAQLNRLYPNIILIMIFLFLLYRNLNLVAVAFGMKVWKYYAINFAAIYTIAFIFDLLSGSNARVGLLFDIFKPKFVRFFDIQGESMLPALPKGGQVIVDRTVAVSQLQRGDVIIFNTVGRAGQTVVYVKRIVGLPGDYVQLRHGRLWINRQLVPRVAIAAIKTEGYDGRIIDAPAYVESPPGGHEYKILKIRDDKGFTDDTEEIQVLPDTFFVLGDNRDLSNDSRVPRENGGFGLIPAKDIVGKAYFGTYPRDVGYLYKAEQK